jgi:hypothetical protein
VELQRGPWNTGAGTQFGVRNKGASGKGEGNKVTVELKKRGVGKSKGGSARLTSDLQKAGSQGEVLQALDIARIAARPLKTIEASMAAHRLGKYGCSPEHPTVEWFFGELGKVTIIMEPQGVANTAWGLAKMRVSPSDPIWQNIMRRSVKLNTRNFEPQTIANLMWAFATAGVTPDAALVEAMSTAAISKSDRFLPQNIANLMWALATSGVPPDAALVEAMSSVAVSKSQDFNSQNITNLMWAFATLGVTPDAALVQAMSAEAVSKANAFNSLAISGLMWAFATSGLSPDAALVRAMTSEAILKKGDFDAQEIANLMWAFATLGISPDVALVQAFGQ